MNELQKQEKELLKKLFFYPLILTVVSVVLTGVLIFAVIFKYEQKDALKNLDAILNLKKEYIKDKVKGLSSHIDNALKLAKEETKEDIKRNVDDVYKDLISIKNLNLNKNYAIKFLQNLNKYKKNYIFAYDGLSGSVYVHKIKKFIGKNTKMLITKSGLSVYERNKKALKNGGFYETYFYKPNDLTKKYLKINYIKYVPVYNLIIGSGEYVDNMKKKIIKRIIERIMLIRYGKNNYFYVIKPNGVLLANPMYKEQIGTNVLNLKDQKGKYFIKEIISKAMSNKNGAFVTYEWINPLTNRVEKKLAFVIYNKYIDAIIGSGLYYRQDIEEFMKKEKKSLKKEFAYINFSILAVILIMLMISTAVSFYLSKRLKNIFNAFNEKTKILLEKVDFEAKHDALTNVPNRKFFNEKLKEEFYRAKRYNFPLSIAMIDIDRFKKINDTYGHEAGDIVLKKLASFINGKIRKSDFFARWGGEEFMLIFPHTDIDKAFKICEKLKEELQTNKKIQHPVKFTVSCGITTLKPGDNIDSLLKRVDDALYLAKNNGRDRIEVIS